MTKNELKNGMIVETRNGNRYIVVNDLLMRKEGYINKSDLKDDLTAPNGCGLTSLDIMKVYREINTLDLDEADVLLWERKESPELGDIYVDDFDGEKFIIIKIVKDYDTLYHTINITGDKVYDSLYNENELSQYKFVTNNKAMVKDFNMLLENLKKAQ